MKSIFTKTLVAASLASFGFANAATIGTVDTSTTAGIQPQKISAEGYAELGYIMIGDTTTTNDITATWTSGINYNLNDTITVTITGGTIANTAATQMTLVNTTDAGAASDATLTAIGFDAAAGTITFRPEVNPATIGDVYELRGVRLTSVGSTVAISAAGQTLGGQAIDQAAGQTVATMSSQFSLSRTSGVALDRVIDVENSRKQFTGTGDVVTDTVTFDLGNSADLLAVSLGTASFTLKGSDLAFMLDADGDLDSGSYTVQGATAASSGDTVPAINDANTQFSFGTSGAPTGSFGVAVVADGNTTAGSVLSAQTFTADLSYSYSYQHDGSGFASSHGTSTDSVSYSDQAAGEWTLSGANVDVEFMPFGGGITQFVYVTNNGGVSGDIEVTAIDESGTVFGPVAVAATATANSVTNITAALVTALTDSGANTSTGRLAFTLTVNSPSADIEVTAGYNSRGDRVLVK